MGNGSSYKLAIIIAIIIALYFGLRTIFAGGGGTEDVAVNRPADDRFTVVGEQVTPQTWQQRIVVRGRTKAIRTVTIRSETTGLVANTPVEAGAQVKTGDVLCELKVDAREAQLSQAKAAIAKARIDYNAARELNKEGFSSNTALATAKAALDLASANLREAELGLSKSLIRAPFEGTFDQRMAEAGDLLRPGDPCGVLIQQSPYLVVGAVSEKDVGKISTGDTGVATLATGETVEGTVRFIARSADPATRTFDVELEIPNASGQLRDGVTAEFAISASRREAYLIRRSVLVLADDGSIGVRTVNDGGAVEFNPVKLLGDNASGIWVSGLSGNVTLITRGQEFVSAGQQVNVSNGSDEGAKLLHEPATPEPSPASSPAMEATKQ